MTVRRDDPAAFVAARRARWERLAATVDGAPPDGAAAWAGLAADWRALCTDLAEARELDLPDDVRRWLDGLAARAHDRLYGHGGTVQRGMFAWVRDDVPREVRASGAYVLASAVLLYGPMIASIVAASASPGFAEALMAPEMLARVEAMYEVPISERSAAENAQMLGFYVMNNVGIAFRCFATGVLAGLGTVFFLVYNGAVIGTVFGHLGRVGLGDNLLLFVVGHGAWELNGIVLAGAAGLRLGDAIVRTGGRTVAGSLRAAMPATARLVGGAAVMIGVAAVIEGLWSASPVPGWGKIAFGAVQAVVVVVWWARGGRG